MERKSGQKEWSELLKLLIADNPFHLTKEMEDNIPFPLLYQLLSTQLPAPAHLSSKEIQDEEKRLADTMRTLNNHSNIFLDQLPMISSNCEMNIGRR